MRFDGEGGCWIIELEQIDEMRWEDKSMSQPFGRLRWVDFKDKHSAHLRILLTSEDIIVKSTTFYDFINILFFNSGIKQYITSWKGDEKKTCPQQLRDWMSQPFMKGLDELISKIAFSSSKDFYKNPDSSFHQIIKKTKTKTQITWKINLPFYFYF